MIKRVRLRRVQHGRAWIVKTWRNGDFYIACSNLPRVIFRIASPSIHGLYSQEDLRNAYKNGYLGM